MKLIAYLILTFSILFTQQSFARDLSNRIGLGISDSFSFSLPSITARYYSSENIGYSLAVGVDTQKNSSRFGLLAKAYKILFKEEMLNFYMGAAVGMTSEEVNNVSQSGFELGALFGCEFFFQGLESIGFSIETGINVSSTEGDVRFQTIANSPFRAGIIFYF